ncbi:MAG: hypothetical protein KY453_05430 [Gemmatimonadetes bacterium]|nr:hypothetical protein [Gemmatimonadota bacterium]
MHASEPRKRSVAFLEHEERTWSCFLVTFEGEDGRWHGYFAFRPQDGEMEEEEVRTADIFIEGSEADIDHKARGLGRPLLSGLLASALHTQQRNGGTTPRLRRTFRSLLRENSRRLAGEWERRDEGPEVDVDELRSLYASYRLDQVAHLIALLRPEDFQQTVDRILDGRPVDFGGKDRLQFAMTVVEHLERLLPLPTFEVWAEDFLAHRETYRLYAHTLHREGRLP